MKNLSLPKAEGIDLQYRMMLLELADKAQKRLAKLHWWQFKKRAICEQVICDVYQAYN
jgi:hypothetical protein